MTPPTLTLVVSSSCHLCEDARRSLEELASEFRLDVRLVDAASPEGWALLARYRAGLVPLAILDGEWFSAGRLPRRKLRKALEARQVPA
ncbi:MAG: glutaredoxin family protein [Actinomycetota bacterium]